MDTTKLPSPPRGATMYLGRRDTRWDPYPQREPVQVVAHNYDGFWELARREDGSWFWFKTATSFVFVKQAIDAEQACATWECEHCGAQWTDRPVGYCYQCAERAAHRSEGQTTACR